MIKQFEDHLNTSIEINFPPKRIISLVPSQTELLYDLGLENEIVGITRFCIHPKDKFKEKVKIGGTKNFNFDKIRALKPDLIIANKEENYKEGIEQLAKEFPVWVSEIYSFEDNLKMITDIGKLCDKEEQAKNISTKIKTDFIQIIPQKIEIKVAYLIWNNPMMSINKNTFINEILSKVSFTNVFKNHKNRYPEISEEELLNEKPNFIFLSSEPYPFKEKHLNYFKTKFPLSRTILIDGEMFSWYGSRLLKFYDYYKKTLLPLLG